ncbi:hypothetical protein H7849_11755 [Alloacidobacterium dinghuense]|uniref:Uncharacterized protein n=1 Tax=Alloacidobacterium dinghuense TaxID=2763107 RepID=A0A7G8BPN0_9BACT|nr:hypothetical protein [Alloacidobacterium dinghuense]QNI34500.1 hypothetical protein H7849_11755 [Alloacidobacterium dinghuense]
MSDHSLETEAWDQLFSTQCECGSTKVKKQSFCRRCYFSLPRELQQALYRSFSEGYVEAWSEARDYLKEERTARSHR